MPFTKTDYSKTIIYKICCNDLNITDIYIGSTTNFRGRKNDHKSLCNNKIRQLYNNKLYQFIRDNGNWENWSMVEIEKYSCNDGNEKRARERYWYEILKPSLNMVRPLQTEEEYKEQQKQNNKDYEKTEQRKEYRSEYQLKRKEKITCTCGAILSRSSKSSHVKTFKHISKTQSLFSE